MFKLIRSAGASMAVAVFLMATSPAAAVSTEVVATGLIHPWALAFVDDGAMLVTEREGQLRLITNDGRVSEPLSGLPAVDAGRQGGLLDVITDRQFARNRMIYFCYSRPDPDRLGLNSTALASARLSEDSTALTDTRDLYVQDPASRGGLHFGCRIVDRGDGTLLMGLGDRYQLMAQAQDKSNDIGKVIRVNKDGTTATDNLFVGDSSASAAVWSYGHRNIQGAALDDQGRLWMTEHGPQGGDELNLIKPGVNYGWPVITYGVNYGGGQIGAGIVSAPDMAQPVTYWVPSIAPSGLAYIDTDRYGPSWQGSLLAGSLKFGQLVRLTMNERGQVSKEDVLTGLGQRVRDVRLGPDGFVYLLTDSRRGQVLRVLPY